MTEGRVGDLATIRLAYARQVMAAAGAADERVERALAETRREDFLGPGPWPVLRWGRGFVDSPTADPIYVYTDDLIAISADRQINNGQPSLHAHLLCEAAIRVGEHVVHVGAGVGYYSALMAHLAGPSGRVTAIEFQPDLAARAAANLAAMPNVRVIEGDGAAVAFGTADVIYVNAGATRPADSWLDGLSDGGRLVLPLTADEWFSAGDLDDAGALARRGAVFVITRQGAEFLARWVSPVAIYPCQGMRDEVSGRALAAAFKRGGWSGVTRLRRDEPVADELCWLKAPGWSLTYA